MTLLLDMGDEPHALGTADLCKESQNHRTLGWFLGLEGTLTIISNFFLLLVRNSVLQKSLSPGIALELSKAGQDDFPGQAWWLLWECPARPGEK